MIRFFNQAVVPAILIFLFLVASGQPMTATVPPESGARTELVLNIPLWVPVGAFLLNLLVSWGIFWQMVGRIKTIVEEHSEAIEKKQGKDICELVTKHLQEQIHEIKAIKGTPGIEHP